MSGIWFYLGQVIPSYAVPIAAAASIAIFMRSAIARDLDKKDIATTIWFLVLGVVLYNIHLPDPWLMGQSIYAFVMFYGGLWITIGLCFPIRRRTRNIYRDTSTGIERQIEARQNGAIIYSTRDPWQRYTSWVMKLKSARQILFFGPINWLVANAALYLETQKRFVISDGLYIILGIIGIASLFGVLFTFPLTIATVIHYAAGLGYRKNIKPRYFNTPSLAPDTTKQQTQGSGQQRKRRVGDDTPPPPPPDAEPVQRKRRIGG